jgi:hypothetical protein
MPIAPSLADIEAIGAYADDRGTSAIVFGTVLGCEAEEAREPTSTLE